MIKKNLLALIAVGFVSYAHLANATRFLQEVNGTDGDVVVVDNLDPDVVVDNLDPDVVVNNTDTVVVVNGTDNQIGNETDPEAPFAAGLPLLYNNSANTDNETLNAILSGAQCDGGMLYADSMNPIASPPILPAYAYSLVQPRAGGNVTGLVSLAQLTPGMVSIEVNLSGFEPNSLHAFQLLEFGDIAATGCEGPLDSYNPYKYAQGGPFSCQRALGDLGNLRADEAGNVVANLTRPSVSLIGPFSAVGRGLVIREGASNYGMAMDGEQGEALACGAIATARIRNFDYNTMMPVMESNNETVNPDGTNETDPDVVIVDGDGETDPDVVVDETDPDVVVDETDPDVIIDETDPDVVVVDSETDPLVEDVDDNSIIDDIVDVVNGGN